MSFESVDDVEFNEQHRLFLKAHDNPVPKEAIKTTALGVQYINSLEIPAKRTGEELAHQRKRKDKGDPSIIDGPGAYLGPWAGFEEIPSSDDQRSSTEEEEEVVVEPPREAPETQATLIAPGSERTVLHRKPERDYLGRTYMSLGYITANCDRPSLNTPNECFIPKKCIYTYKGHSKGVNAIRLLPKSAHLLLSASMDHKVKLWSAIGDHKVLRTYHGHNGGVRDICFDSTGARFLTASYDKYIKLWDTETGQCIESYTTGKLPYCIKFNPDQDNLFLTGQQDNKICQFDIKSGKIIQEYNQHLGPVNTITFVDENRRFVSTSDDRSLRAWEFDIPTVIKYIAEPNMHSIPSVALSPSSKWMACQSLDNSIYIYSAAEKFKINNKKVFRGHMIAGYACQVNFSPDSRYLISGDSEGYMCYWDFKTTKMLSKQKAHEKVVMGCIWHPFETSKVYTCSWDGTIKLWD